LHDKPGDVVKKFGSSDGSLQLEARRQRAVRPDVCLMPAQEFVLFASTLVKENPPRPLKVMVTPALLREIRDGYHRLETKDGRPLLHARSPCCYAS
jgi:hypothetical protein